MEIRKAARLFSGTMAVPTTDELLTLEEYLALPDDDLYIDELSRGRLVREPRPGNIHGQMVTEIAYLLRSYVEATPVGRVITEAGFLLNRTPLTIRGPDVAFIRNERLQSTKSFFEGAPDLAIEVVSPSNRAGELLQKVGELLSGGTNVVWVVYPQKKIVAEHTLDGSVRVLGENDLLSAPELLPGFELKVRRLFDWLD
jgi:Uma2 family endonuclease